MYSIECLSGKTEYQVSIGKPHRAKKSWTSKLIPDNDVKYVNLTVDSLTTTAQTITP